MEPILDCGVVFRADEASVSRCVLSTINTSDRSKENCFIELDSAPKIQLYTCNMAGSARTLFYGGNFDNCRLYI